MPNQSPRPTSRTAFVRGVSLATRAGRALGLIERGWPDRDTLMTQAVESTGLDDFGDPWFAKPLDVLLDSVREDARLNAAGELSGRKMLEHLLRDRLLAQMWFRRHPEILSRPLRRPVVIVGMMRSGTTRLHRMLAADHRFAHLRSFETISPVPRPGYEDVMAGRAADFRPKLARRILAVARLANPRTLSIHPTGPYQPEEELGLIAQSFYGMKFEAQWRVPAYARWCEDNDATPAYRHMADLLRLVGWSQQESSLRPWILKTPQHMLDLPALLKVFPDARIIVSHRDPCAVVGSAASLAWNQTAIYSDAADPGAVGTEWLRKTALMSERMMAARAAVPKDRIIDVHYDAMDRDWRGTMERIYGFLGLDLAPALPAMEAYAGRSAPGKRRPHRYSLAEYGLTREQVEARMAGYIDAFDVPAEIGQPRRRWASPAR